MSEKETPQIIAALRAEIESVPAGELPAIIGQIEALKAEAFARLVSPHGPAEIEPESPHDRLLTVEETANLLGQTSRWVRDHKLKLPRVKLPGRTLRFSEKRLATLIKQRSYG